MAPGVEGLSLAATLQRHPNKMACAFLQTGTVPATPPGSGWKWDAEEAQPLPDPWIHPFWYLPAGALAHATGAVKKAFPPPQSPGALLRSLQAGAALIRWRENGRPGPYSPLVQGQALLHAEGMGTVEWGAIVPDTASRGITAAAPDQMQPPPAGHHLLPTVPPLAPRHALTQEVWWALLSQPREWMTTLGARYPRGPVLERLTAPTPGVCPPKPTAPCRGRSRGGPGGTVADSLQPLHRARPLVPAPTPLPPAGGPRAPPAGPV